jgi:hypothetical protein
VHDRVDALEGGRVELLPRWIPEYVSRRRSPADPHEPTDGVPIGGERLGERRADESTRTGDGDGGSVGDGSLRAG